MCDLHVTHLVHKFTLAQCLSICMRDNISVLAKRVQLICCAQVITCVGTPVDPKAAGDIQGGSHY